MVTVLFNGEECYSIRDMAELLGRSGPSLKYLATHPTRTHRPLKMYRDGCHCYIPISEIEEFPWHDGSLPYRYVPDSDNPDMFKKVYDCVKEEEVQNE